MGASLLPGGRLWKQLILILIPLLFLTLVVISQYACLNLAKSGDSTTQKSTIFLRNGEETSGKYAGVLQRTLFIPFLISGSIPNSNPLVSQPFLLGSFLFPTRSYLCHVLVNAMERGPMPHERKNRGKALGLGTNPRLSGLMLMLCFVCFELKYFTLAVNKYLGLNF